MNISWKALLSVCIVVLLVAVWVVGNYSPTRAAIIDATVKLSICGNGVIEGGEDCENTNLSGSSCQTFGYTTGTLSCDIACTFDKTSCITNIAPTAIPIRSVTSAIIQSEPIVTDSQPLAQPAQTLPPELRFFDYNGTGRISQEELPIVVKLWISQWRQNNRCDINKDQTCDMKDFSVLMYYVDPA